MAYRGADPTDVMGRRMGAYLIDGVLSIVVFLAVVWPLFLSASTEITRCPVRPVAAPANQADPGPAYCVDLGDSARVIPRGEGGAFNQQVVLVSIAITVVTSVLLQGVAGGTPGKLVLGLRVVRSDGTFAGLGRCALRTLLLPVDGACCAVVGLLTAFKSKGHRRLGDMVAGTMVIGRDDQLALMLARSGATLPDRKTIAAQAYAAGNPGAVAPPGASYVGVPDPGWPTPDTTAPDIAAPETLSAAGPVPGIDAPLWDEQRRAFIQYDPALGAWVQWDDATGQWDRIR